jgi:cytoskeletal protein CcmA (bactofilin family)
MFKQDTPKRRFSDRSADVASAVGTGMLVTGTLNCEGDLLVAGSVKGEAKIGGRLSLLPQGRWEGKIETSNAVVAGTIEGEIVVTGRLEIHKSACIKGSVHAQTLAVAEGAIIDGPMIIQGDMPVVQFKEKRKT